MVSLLWINILKQYKRITAYRKIGYLNDGRDVLACYSCLILYSDASIVIN